MDITNRCVKICRRIDEIEYILACKDRTPVEEGDLLYEKLGLEQELADLKPAN